MGYAGGDVPQVNLGLMPALVDSYEQGLRWKDAPIGEALRRVLEDKNIVIVTWIWQAGGIASNKKASWRRQTAQASRSAAAARMSTSC